MEVVVVVVEEEEEVSIALPFLSFSRPPPPPPLRPVSFSPLLLLLLFVSHGAHTHKFDTRAAAHTHVIGQCARAPYLKASIINTYAHCDQR